MQWNAHGDGGRGGLNGKERRASGRLLGQVAMVSILLATTLVSVGPSATAQTAEPVVDEGRIVNGTVAVPGQVPYHVGFVYPDGRYWGCGGSIINSRTVLTAEHCFPPEESTDGVFVRAGVLNIADGGGQDVAISEIRLHPAPGDIRVADLAIVHLATDLTFNADVGTALIPTPAEVMYGAEALVSGWGLTSEGGVGSDLLLAASVTLIDDTTCFRLNDNVLTPSAEICASSSPGDTCQNDSGGPMVQQVARGPIVVGVTSWGWQCGPPNPGIYSDVAEFAQWINDNLAPGTTEPGGGGPGEPPVGAPRCADEVVTVDLNAGQMPTDGDDVILGTAGDDSIAAGAGDDIVCGGGGNDSIWGQAGFDELHGGDGDDRLRGGDDDDVLLGGTGVDDIAGGRGDDFIEGGDGDDKVLRGGTGDDNISAGDGDDVLSAGNGGEDLVSGGAGDDKVTGGPRPDVLVGGEGADELRGLGGADQLFGGDGDDTLFGGKQPDSLDGGDGLDICNGGTTGNDAIEGDTAVDCENELVNIP